ncbi:uncharacterized protein LOC142983517 [Anticarsia gemmatalis]|uniref:uncharacterized protein LOC142983517 n=1 Tax=Anticarsia gemmatalis TaxID=129554 RepID=UPI003F7690BE
MAVTRRGYIFGAFLLSVLCVLLIVVAISSDSWVVSSATAETLVWDSSLRYGLFRGELVIYELATPDISTLYMTCVSELNACALSCKTEAEARIVEVRALAERFTPSAACLSETDVDTNNLLETAPVISYAFYVSVLVILFLQLVFAVTSAALAIVNATKNPTEPIFGLPGCLWSNGIAAILGLTVLLLFGIYWSTSGLKDHLAVSYIALGFFVPGPALGYSYWVLITSIFCSIANVGLIQARAYLLERDPPPPTIKLENHSDGTIFLY